MRSILSMRQSSFNTQKKIIPRRGIEEFYDLPTTDGTKLHTGRAWSASELRLKSFSDLHKLWFVLLKEKNMLLTQREAFRKSGERESYPSPYRLRKVRKSMARIQVVLGERKKAADKAKQMVREIYAQRKQEERIRAIENKMLEDIEGETLELKD
eukprot:TRINITY_DN2117_c0_g1_i1.p1 TRINITY_DN2117_c0_g1~~TRINITY_DN2117_c0_g1_i1.p1  ORF type:complete len:155 (-),score=35.84 TRINITY_DN2117_c0_g1_i1:16-480(-)